MWFNLTEDDITAIEFGGKLKQAELAQRIRAQQAEQQADVAQAYRLAVTTDDELECDEDAVVSFGDGGAFVQTWTWVYDVEATLDDEL